MKKFIIIISSFVAVLIITISVMFTFKICPPSGPWPTPPWCSLGFERKVYNIEVNPKKIHQIKAVNMFDTWGRNYNMGMVETTQENISSSFDRVRELGAEEVYIHDFHRVIYDGSTDFKNLNYKIEDEIFLNDFRDESIKEEDLKKIVFEAHKRGLKIGIKHNLSFVNIGKYIIDGITGDIQKNVEKDAKEFNLAINEEWIKDYFPKWQKRLVEKAILYQSAGVDIMSISPAFMSAGFTGNEELVNDLYKTLISEVRKEFKGKIYAEINLYGLIDGYLGKENWDKYDYYKDADIKEVRVYNLPDRFQAKENLVKVEIFLSVEKLVNEINKKAKEKGVKLSIFFAPSSYKNSINKGPVEIYDLNNSLIKNLEVDMEEQANSFDAMFNSLNNMNNIERINVGNFAWDDAMDPEVKPRISITAIFRNKPAEDVVKAWFLKK